MPLSTKPAGSRVAVRNGRSRLPLRRQAQAARAHVEHVLEATGWHWSRRLSLWIDVLVILEEAEP
jgi:hypothetical protein